MLVPLAFRGRSVGVLVAFDRISEERGFDREDERLLGAFAASAATAVATGRSVEEQRMRQSIEASEQERRRWARELHDADDGGGFDPATSNSGGFGLMGMRERVALADGDLDIDPVRRAPPSGRACRCSGAPWRPAARRSGR